MANFRARFTLKDAQEDIKARFKLQEETIPAILKVETSYKLEGSELIAVERKAGSVLKLTSKTFIFIQEISSDTWIIPHNLNKRPSVIVVDTADEEQVPDEKIYNDNNTVTLKFLSEFAGRAYLN